MREVSRKTENIALSVKDNLKNEAQSHYDRITLLENIKRQIDFYVSSLDEFSSRLFRLKYVEGKAVKQICDILSDKARQYSEWSIHDRIKKITLNFLAITPLSEFQMKHALER